MRNRADGLPVRGLTETTSGRRLTPQQRQLAERHLPVAEAVVSTLRRRLPYHADFENLTGEAQLALVHAAASWKGTGSFEAFAAVCIRNALSTAIGAAARATSLPFRLDENAGVGIRAAHADFAGEAIALADHRSARSVLTARERRVVALAVAGFGPRDQAALLRLSVGAVKQRLRRARRRLVAQLAV